MTALTHKLTRFRPRTTAAQVGVRSRNPLTLALWASLWIAGFANWPLWQNLAALPEMQSARGMVFGAAFFGIVAAVIFLLLVPFAWRRSIKPAVALFLVAAAAGAHFMGTYGIVIDSTMIQNVLHTDPREVRDLLSVNMAGNLLLLAGLPLWWLWHAPATRAPVSRQLVRNGLSLAAAGIMIAALIFFMYADLSATMRNHRTMRFLINPVNSFYAMGVLAHEAGAKRKGPLQPIGLDARIAPLAAGAKPPLLLLVVGETARAQNFSLNGYARPTNPELEELGVVSFRNVSSCGTSTAASLPCMFSHLGRTGYEDRPADYENLVDLLNRAGLAVLWLDNQSGCKGLCDRIPRAQANTVVAGGTALPDGLCNAGECMDGALLHDLDARLAALPAERRARGVVLVLHQMGSHGPAYASRSPVERKRFLPECTTNMLQQCDAQQLVNAYDNSIAYTDHVLAGGIAWLKRQTAAFDPSLLYLSDHGESLGENNLYLHGLPYALAPKVQTQVPFIVWMPPARGEKTSATLACLDARRDQPLSHDNLFHTVLGLLRVAAREYRSKLDVTASCGNAAAPVVLSVTRNPPSVTPGSGQDHKVSRSVPHAGG